MPNTPYPHLNPPCQLCHLHPGTRPRLLGALSLTVCKFCHRDIFRPNHKYPEDLDHIPDEHLINP